MLRLNVYCSLIPSSSHVKLGRSYGSWIIHYHRSWKQSQGFAVKALKDGETSGYPGRNWDPGLEIEVPFEQRPVCNMFTLNYVVVIEKRVYTCYGNCFLRWFLDIRDMKSSNGGFRRHTSFHLRQVAKIFWLH